MKKQDIAIIILIVAISALAAYLIGRAVVGDPQQQSVQVPTVEAISTNVEEPDSRVFNDDAINPTVEINIGDSSNEQPFSR
jgi:hypothetical protein